MYDVLTVGSATKDVFLVSKNFKFVKSDIFKTGVGECFSYGSKIELKNIYFDTGGGATNSAYTFSNMNLKTGVITKVGDDIYGKEIKEVLNKNKIDTKNISIDKHLNTAYATILLTPGKDRTILVYRGASANFAEKDLKLTGIKTKWIYLTSLGANFKMLDIIFNYAKKNKIKIAWNPGNGELKKGFNFLKKYIKYTEIFITNFEEAVNLTKKGDIKTLFSELNNLGNKYNIITQGKKGAYVSCNNVIYHADTLGAKPLNSTGAGDAFGSGFCSGIIIKDNLKYALSTAILNSEGVVQKMGAKNGLLKKRPGKESIKKVKVKIFSKI